MKIIFLGVGEAFDFNLPNNSHLVITEKTKLLLDCGYNMPQQLWKYSEDPDLLDAIYISHHHADHSFGLPAILMRMWEGGREKDLTLICPDEVKNIMDYAYKDFTKKFKYKFNFIKPEEDKYIEFQTLKLFFQRTVHSGENLAVKISDREKTIAYSGDGSPKEGNDFYKNLDFLILETYLYDKEIIGHSSIKSAIAFAEKNNVKCLALTHMNRDFRKNELPKIKDQINSQKVKIIIPEPLTEYNL